MIGFDPLTHAYNFLPEFGEYKLTDHLPMAAFALGELGAGDKRIQQFASKYKIRLKSATSQGGIFAHDDAIRLLGKGHNYCGYLRYYRQRIETLGSAKALRRYLPILACGASSRAFHGAIRTAYGVDSDNPVEIAAGLAYWSDTLEVINIDPDPLAETANLPILEQLGSYSRIVATVAGAIASSGRSISEQVNYVANRPELSPLLRGSAATSGLTLSAIAGTAVRVYLCTGDFTALHCVTGAHAFRVLEPFLDDPRGGLSALWVGICLAYCTIGAPLISEPQNVDRPCSWNTIKRRSIRSDDDHDIKFAYSCLKEDCAYESDLYLRAAAQRLNL
jgi:hypothetical protein